MAKSVRQLIYDIIRKEAVERAVFSLIGKTAGFKAWLIKNLLEYAFDEVFVPMMNWAIRNGRMYYDIRRGKILIRKLDQARVTHDQQSYDSTIDDIIG